VICRGQWHGKTGYFDQCWYCSRVWAHLLGNGLWGNKFIALNRRVNILIVASQKGDITK